MKLKKPSWIRVISGKGFIFVDNDNICESSLNNSKLHLNKKGTQQIAKNILSSLDNIWYATTRSIRPDVKNRLLSASTSISEERKQGLRGINSTIYNKLFVIVLTSLLQQKLKSIPSFV